MCATKTQWRFALRGLALFVGLVRVVATVVVPVAHKLSRRANRICALELENATLAAIRLKQNKNYCNTVSSIQRVRVGLLVKVSLSFLSNIIQITHMTFAMRLIRCVRTITTSIAPLMFRNARSIVALTHSIRTLS